MSGQAESKKPNRVNFTKTNIEAILPPVSGRLYVYDTKIAGLAVCVSATGGKVFYLYKKINGKPERVKIGKWPHLTVEQARTEADRINGRIADGTNPAEKRRSNAAAPTLGEVFDEYIESPTRGRSKRPRSAKTVSDYRWQFAKYLEPWRSRRLLAIKRADVNQLHNTIGAGHGHYIANRILALLKALFNFAIESEYTQVNPAARLRAFEEQSRDRFLGADELPRFWRAVEADPAADFIKLLLFTGARRGNVLAARWEEIDLQAATWKIPHTKNGQPLTLPLSPAVVELLKNRRRTIEGEWVFPSSDGKGPMTTPRNGWRRILKASGLEDFRLHDLRRSLGSWQAAGGSSLSIIGKSLGHESVQATKIYARVDLETVRQSVDTATAAILAAANKPEKNSDE